LTIEDSITETLSVSDHVQAALVPGNQTRDWKQRWNLVQHELALILSPHTETISGGSIHVALQRFFSFLVSAYHLKDALKDASLGIGLSASAVEDAVTNDVRLALLADLANLDKHMKLARAAKRNGSSYR
jgi:hypothetical protein